MRDNDTVILESLYNNLVVEGVEDQKKQAENLLIANRVGREIWKYKNKPENQQAIEQARQEVQPVFQQLLGIAEPYQQDPFGKNMGHLPELTKFYLQKPDLNLLQREYGTYMSIGSIKNKNLIKKETDFIKWAEAIHSAEALENLKKQPKEEPAQEGNQDAEEKDENVVYEDESVIVYLANNVNDPQQSIKNCQKYGKGSTLCISRPDARTYYHQYRWDDKLTTYFVRLKNSRRYILIDATEDGNFQYNNITDNTDRDATKEEILAKYPELTKAFEQNVFKSIPIQGKELEYYEKFYNARNIFSSTLTTVEDRVTYATISDIAENDWKSYFLMTKGVAGMQPIPMEEIKLVLQAYIESTERDIPHWVLKKFPALERRYWSKKENDIRRELEEWGEDDEENFTTDEMKILVDNKDLLDMAIKVVPRIKSAAESVETTLDKIKRNIDKNGVYADHIDLKNAFFPVDLSFVKSVKGFIGTTGNAEINLSELRYCEGIEARYLKSINLKKLEHVKGGIGLGNVDVLDLPNLVTCDQIDSDKAKIVNLPKLIRAKSIRLGSAEKIELPNLLSLDLEPDYYEQKTMRLHGTLAAMDAKEIIAPKLRKCLVITANGGVQKIDLSSLEEIRVLSLRDCVVESISFPFTSIYELNLGHCAKLNLPNLEKANEIVAIDAVEVNIPKLKFCPNLYLSGLKEVILPKLEIGDGEYIFHGANKIDLRNVKEIGTIRAEKAQVINLNSLQKIGRDAVFDLPSIKELNLPNLEVIEGGSDYYRTPELEVLILPKLIQFPLQGMKQWVNKLDLKKLVVNADSYYNKGLFNMDDREGRGWANYDRFKNLNFRVQTGKLELRLVTKEGKLVKHHPRPLVKESFKNHFNTSK